MESLSRLLIKCILGIEAAMIIIVTFHIGGIFALRIGQFSPLFGALAGGSLVLIYTEHSWNSSKEEDHDKNWTPSEQLSWLLIGLGMLAWGLGDCFWRYYVAWGEAPFPSLADIGYVTFPLLTFIGLLLQPQSHTRGKRILLIMDSLITTGAILAIAWYLLLGALAQAPTEASLGKFLGLYYPTSDIILLSCIAIFLLRNQEDHTQRSQAQRMSLLLMGLGLCFFITSDLIFNVQQNAGTYVEATWVDLGWPLGMLTIGLAACIRRFPLPAFVANQQHKRQTQSSNIYPAQYLPYVLVGGLFLALVSNGLSQESSQQAIRPVLLLATLIVVGLVIARQIITMHENTRLLYKQIKAHEELSLAHQRVEEQSRQMTEQNIELERGIDHLKDIQASLANGNLQARATLTHGALWPLAASFNLMAERLTRFGQDLQYSHRLRKALGDLSNAIQQGDATPLPAVYYEFPEISQLIAALQSQAGNPNSAPDILTTNRETGPHSPLTPRHTSAFPAVTRPTDTTHRGKM